MTTTRNTLEKDTLVGGPVAYTAVEQRRNWMDEAAPSPVPWSELAPSDYEALSRWFPSPVPDEDQQAPATSPSTPRQVVTSRMEAQAHLALNHTHGFRLREAERQRLAMAAAVAPQPVINKKCVTKAALLAAVLALVDTGVAHLNVEEKDHVFGLFVSRTAWVSKGYSEESWPRGSIESCLQGSLVREPVPLRGLVAGWIGPERPDPWADMWDRIVRRLVRQGTVERRQEKQSFLFFNWMKTIHRPAERTKDALADYASIARRTGLGLPLLDRSPSSLAQSDVILSGITQGFAAQTEMPAD